MLASRCSTRLRPCSQVRETWVTTGTPFGQTRRHRSRRPRHGQRIPTRRLTMLQTMSLRFEHIGARPRAAGYRYKRTPRGSRLLAARFSDAVEEQHELTNENPSCSRRTAQSPFHSQQRPRKMWFGRRTRSNHTKLSPPNTTCLSLPRRLEPLAIQTLRRAALQRPRQARHVRDRRERQSASGVPERGSQRTRGRADRGVEVAQLTIASGE